MRLYTCVLAVVVPSLINTVLNLLIFARVLASSRRVQPSVHNPTANNQHGIISRREMAVLRQMIFTFFIGIVGWAPIFIVIIINYFIPTDVIAILITSIISQLCILWIITSLFIYNHDLREYLSNKVRLCFRL